MRQSVHGPGPSREGEEAELHGGRSFVDSWEIVLLGYFGSSKMPFPNYWPLKDPGNGGWYKRQRRHLTKPRLTTGSLRWSMQSKNKSNVFQAELLASVALEGQMSKCTDMNSVCVICCGYMVEAIYNIIPPLNNTSSTNRGLLVWVGERYLPNACYTQNIMFTFRIGSTS
eukprot:scaffold3716_cov69-Cylindrotheca_fusiformis.AAC.33